MDSSDTGGGGFRPLRLTTYEGEPALLVPRWTTPPRVGRAVLLGLALGATAGAVWVGWSGSSGAAFGLGLLAVLLAAFVLRDAVCMPYSGGLWLTPTRLVHEHGRTRWALPWDEVGEVVHDGDDVVVLARDGSRHTVRAHLLVTDQRSLWALVDGFGGQPARHSSLGSEESLTVAEQVRTATEPPDFRPVVQGALPSSPQVLFLAALVLVGVLLALAALGRATTVDDDDLAQALTESVRLGGSPLQEVSCDGAIGTREGATQTCSAVVEGRELRLLVTVTAADGDRIEYAAEPAP